MKRYVKGFLCFIFSFLMITAFIPFDAEAMTSDSGTLGDNFTWSYSYGSLYITGSGALPTCEELGLDQYPWADFETMDVTIDNGITSIPSGAFSAIGYVTLPKTVKYISSGAFTDLYRLQLTSYSADCVYDENAFVFAAEPAGKVTAYKGSTSEALSEKYSLEFSSMGEKLYSSYSDGTLSYYFYDDCAYVADYLGTSDVVTIPETVEGYTVKGIGGNAFAFSKITQVNMPDTITEIREKAFYSCSTLTSVKFSDKLEYIWNEAFYYCIRLSDAALPDSVLSIGDFAFYSCKTMTGLNLGENISYIGEAAFEDCSITSIEIPSSLNLIQPYTFRECHELESVTFSGAIEKIHYNAFLYTPVFETLDIPAGTEVIMGECEVERSDSGTVIVPDFVTSMYCNSYYGFSTITIGSNVREFLVPEFDMSDDYDSSLTEINVSENNPYFYAEDGVVYNKDKTVMLYAAPGHKFEDGVMTIPASVTEIRCVIINESITEFAVEEGNSVFSAYEGVLMNDIERSVVRYPSGKTDTGYIVPSFAETISEGAFYGAKLKNILIPSTVKAVEKGAFWETETDSIVFKHTESDELDLADDMEGYFITYFSGETGFISADTDYYVYDGSPAAVKFPSNAVFIDSVQSGTHGSSFTWSLKDLTLTVSGTGSMNKVNTGVYPWSSLPFTDVVFEGSGIVIPEKAFENIGTLCSADLSGVTDIGLRAFYGCRYLSEITDHDSVEFVGNLAFDDTQWISVPQDSTNMNVLGKVLVKCIREAGSGEIPDCVEFAAPAAFSDTGIDTLYIPEKGVMYDHLAFYGNSSIEHIRFTGSERDIKLKDLRDAADQCEWLVLTDSSGAEHAGYGYASDNTLINLAEALYGTHYMENIIREYCTGILSLLDSGTDYTDQQIIDMLYSYSSNNISYGSIYIETENGAYSGSERSWEKSRNLTHEADGIAIFDMGVCSSFADLVNVYVDLINETDISSTLISDRKIGLNHEWNAVGLDTGTENERWYYLDLSNGSYLIGYQNSMITSNPEMFSYDSELAANEDGTYTVSLSSGRNVNIQSSDAELVTVKGDVNGDGKVAINDATAVLTIYALKASGMEVTGNTAAADVDGNGTADIADATAILTYYAQYSAGMNPDWGELLYADALDVPVIDYAANYIESFSLTWTANGGADGYEVYRINETDGTNVLVGAASGGDNTSWVDYSIPAEGEIYYYVRSYMTRDGVTYFSDNSESVYAFSPDAYLNAAYLEPHDDYVCYDQSTDPDSTEIMYSFTLKDADKATLEAFAAEHFTDDMTRYDKLLYTAEWIHDNVTYAYAGEKWNTIASKSLVDAVFNYKLGQCLQYNGALIGMMAYMGYDVNLIFLKNGSWQHFTGRVHINGITYEIETGNWQDGMWTSIMVPVE